MEAFELRLWDGRLGRWLTVDPYHEFHSPYVGMGNNPINLIDPNGGSTGGPGDDDALYGGTLNEIVVTGQAKYSQSDYAFRDWAKNNNPVAFSWIRQNEERVIYNRLQTTKKNYWGNFGSNYSGGYLNWNPNGAGADMMDISSTLIGNALMGPAAESIMAGYAFSGLSSAKSIGLSDDVAKTFAGGNYKKIVLDSPMTLSRYYDNVGTFAKGRFMTNPTSITRIKFLDRMGLALRPSWNQMTKVAHWNLPEGTVVFKGRAATQFPWIGGRTQYFVPNLNRVIRP